MAQPSRRNFIKASLVLAGAGLSHTSFAADLFDLGNGKIITLSDGTFTMPNTYWPGASEKELASLGHSVTIGANAYLIRRGERIFLIDAGAGNSDFITKQFDTVGKLPAEMADAGFTPKEITDIVITHMHPDHFGGVVSDNKPAFPNATIHIDRSEWDFWTRDGFATQAPEGMRPMVTMLQNTATIIKNQLQLHDGDVDLGEGVNALAAYGHTPGHNSFMLDLGSEQLLVLGDTVVSDHIHFANPSVGWQLDANPEAAEATRRRLLEMAATDGMLVAANHVTAPGLGRIAKVGGAYGFVPL